MGSPVDISISTHLLSIYLSFYTLNKHPGSPDCRWYFIILAHETLEKIRTSKLFSDILVAFKTDMSKAYDRADWGFLRKVLVKMGFPDEFIRIVMDCVQTVSYSIVFNGSPLPPFKPTCGLRQGDPLSPYLFILCMEGMSSYLERLQEQGRFRGVSVTWLAPSISHLLFADDAAFFMRYSSSSCEALKEGIDKFCLTSGQVINLGKCAVITNTGCSEEKREEILELCACRLHLFSALT